MSHKAAALSAKLKKQIEDSKLAVAVAAAKTATKSDTKSGDDDKEIETIKILPFLSNQPLTSDEYKNESTKRLVRWSFLVNPYHTIRSLPVVTNGTIENVSYSMTNGTDPTVTMPFVLYHSSVRINFLVTEGSQLSSVIVSERPITCRTHKSICDCVYNTCRNN